MSLGRTRAVALVGLRGICVDVEADISPGLPRFSLVGLPDRALNEATDRVRAAIGNSGLAMPAQRLTVSLSPASLPKAGSGFDLAIAVAALAASGALPHDSVASVVHIGELALDGRLRPTAGVLPAVLGAAQAGATRVMVPTGNAQEASLVPGVDIIPVSSLAHAAAWHGAPLEPRDVDVLLSSAQSSEFDSAPALDLGDVIGQAFAVEALIAAAAGGHHLFMLGPPGAGKTMLASRLPGILPPLTPEQAIEVACTRSLAGDQELRNLTLLPPFEAPHHGATMAALIGGGSGVIKPGAVARASHGVLFLDEAPEFSSNVLDALRQPLESGFVEINRALMTVRFPARFALVLAANPCPCGQLMSKDSSCTCTPWARRRYLGRISGPLRDRIDLQVPLTPVSRAMMAESAGSGQTTEGARARVQGARAVAVERWREIGCTTNAQVPGHVLRSTQWRPSRAATHTLDRFLDTSGFSMRAYDRTLRLAWTLADLDGANVPDLEHIGLALRYRNGIAA